MFVLGAKIQYVFLLYEVLIFNLTLKTFCFKHSWTIRFHFFDNEKSHFTASSVSQSSRHLADVVEPVDN